MLLAIGIVGGLIASLIIALILGAAAEDVRPHEWSTWSEPKAWKMEYGYGSSIRYGIEHEQTRHCDICGQVDTRMID